MSGNASHDELIAQFRDVTGLPQERAQFYLEASGWELQVALGSFFEHEQMDEGEGEADLGGTGASDSMVSGVSAASETPGAGTGGTRAGPPGAGVTPSNLLATLNSLLTGAGADGSSSDDEPQAFYAGGSVASGQQVLGPPRKKDRDDFIKELFEKAKEHGATADESMGGPGGSSGGTSSARFGGAGYKLGDTSSGTQSHEPAPAAAAASGPRGPREVILRLWRNGFTLDDGELRPYTDPANIMFLDSIKRGEIPRELIRAHPGNEVELAMEDKRTEEWKPPKPSVKPFGGKGQTLGNPTPNVTTAAGADGASKDKEANELAAKSQLNLTDSQPQTNIQIRLADGSRLVGRFNITHTVGDIYNYINTARPQYSSSSYSLVLFPNTELSKREESLKEANLLNAALTQKIHKS